MPDIKGRRKEQYMSKLKVIREQQHLTQEELAEKSGISVRTIQRIESGTEPKGQTLKILARTLGVEEIELLDVSREIEAETNTTLLKLINFSSLLFTVFPPLNIVAPLIIMFVKKEFNACSKQIVSVQILWTVAPFVLFMFSAFMKNWFMLGKNFMLVIMVLLVLSNVFIILRNTAELDKNRKLYFRLTFSII